MKILWSALLQRATITSMFPYYPAVFIFYTRALRHIMPALTEPMAASLDASLVQSRLDYANSIMYGMSASNMHKLQSKINKNSSAFLQKIPKHHHHFPWLSMTLAVFHDFPGLENGLTKFQDFPGRVVTLYRRICKAKRCTGFSKLALSFAQNQVFKATPLRHGQK